MGDGEVIAHGSRIYLVVRALAAPPRGKVYQAWTLARGATRFAASGADVAILARRPEVLEEARQRISETAKGEVAAVACDVSRADDIRRGYDAVMERFGKVDIGDRGEQSGFADIDDRMCLE